MKYYYSVIVGFSLFISSLVSADPIEYILKYKKNGDFSIVRIETKVLSNGTKKYTHSYQQEIPKGYELVQETSCDVVRRVIKENSQELMMLFVGLVAAQAAYCHTEKNIAKKFQNCTAAQKQEGRTQLSWYLAYPNGISQGARITISSHGLWTLCMIGRELIFKGRQIKLVKKRNKVI